VKIQALIRVMTWNAANLTHHGRELALFNLLVSNHVDVMVVTEAELPTLTAASFALPGYTHPLTDVGLLGQVQSGDISQIPTCDRGKCQGLC
jgi:hypothetical protein